METLSVIVPVYNAEPWLRRCVQSLAAQTRLPDEIILVNDGSKDGSLALCEALAREYSNVRVVDRVNGGAAAARNSGLAAASGSLIGFVDADDRIEPDMYERLSSAIEHFQADIACCGRTRDIDGVPGKAELTMPQPCVFTGDEALAHFFAQDVLGESACDKLFRAEIVSGVSFPEGSIGEDILFVYRCLKKAARVCHAGEGACYHYCFETGRASASSAAAGGSHFNVRKRPQLDYPRRIYEDICRCRPNLEQQAQAYYLRRLLDMHVMLCTVGVDEKDAAYRDEVSAEFHAQAGAIRRNPYIPKEKKKVAAVYALNAQNMVAAVSKAVRRLANRGKA